jgi:hypothetical protein
MIQNLSLSLSLSLTNSISGRESTLGATLLASKEEEEEEEECRFLNNNKWTKFSSAASYDVYPICPSAKVIFMFMH